MGREVRRVPADWEHPKYNNPHRGWVYKPLYEGPYEKVREEWEESRRLWEKREDPYASQESYEKYTFEEYHGRGPNPEDYMPSWSEEERTHLMMYETTSEGTPMSPAFETPEELARWLANNGASAFGGQTATYEQWLSTCKSGWAPSAMLTNGVVKSGVAALSEMGIDND